MANGFGGGSGVVMRKHGRSAAGHRCFGTLSKACLAGALVALAVGDAAADGTAPRLPGLAASPVALPGLSNALWVGGNSSPKTAFGPDGRPAPLTLPLSLHFGEGNGVSFLYQAPPTVGPDGKPQHSSPATYGFSNALNFGNNPLHLNGLMYAGGDGKGKSSQVISQGLSYAGGGWKVDAHYQTVGKDFAGLGGAAGTALGPTADAATLSRLQAARGQSEMGFAAQYAGARQKWGISLRQNDDQMAKAHTAQQTLSLSQTFGKGTQFDLSRDVVSSHPLTGAKGQTALTTTTNHLRLGLTPGKDASLSADALLVGDSRGRSEQHLAFAFNGKTPGATLAAGLRTNSSSQGQSDRALNLSFGGRSLQMDGVLTNKQGLNGRTGEDTTRQMHLAWQPRKDLSFEGHWNEEQRTGWKSQGGDSLLALKGTVARNLTVDAHLASKTDGATGCREDHRDMTATLAAPRLAGLRRTQCTVNLAQAVAQGQMTRDTRALRFDGDTKDLHIHFDLASDETVSGKKANTAVTKGVRVATLTPNTWLQYSLLYKQRGQTHGPALVDAQDYSVRMRLHRTMTLSYHYLNQRENPDGSFTDTVQSAFQVGGPLTRTLAWSLHYDRSNVAAGGQGVDSLLAGFEGMLSPHQKLAFYYGLPEQRVGPTVVEGQSFQLAYECKVSDDDQVAFNGELTSWNHKTSKTPNPVEAKVRVDVAKTF